VTIHLPSLNAVLNGTSAILLVSGYVAIRRGHRDAHARFMVAAFATSTLFLASYLYYHFVVAAGSGPTRFQGEGMARTAYLGLLLSHTVLAAVTLPLAVTTFVLALLQRWPVHRRFARWTLPIWLYVSVTGVLVYLALYVWNPKQG
jgi:putative membrane protein